MYNQNEIYFSIEHFFWSFAHSDSVLIANKLFQWVDVNRSWVSSAEWGYLEFTGFGESVWFERKWDSNFRLVERKESSCGICSSLWVIFSYIIHKLSYPLARYVTSSWNWVCYTQALYFVLLQVCTLPQKGWLSWSLISLSLSSISALPSTGSIRHPVKFIIGWS